MKKRVRVKFLDYGSDIPIVPFRISEDAVYFAILDTGSDTTIFDKTFVDKNKDLFADEGCVITDVQGLHGVKAMDIDKVSSMISVGDITKPMLMLKVIGHVLDLSDINSHIHTYCDKSVNVSAVFGSDTFKAAKANIDYKNDELKIEL